MAVLTSFAYARTRVRQGRTGQRVRLAAVVTASTGGVFNLTARWGNYGRTSQRAGTPYFAWSNYPNGPPFEHDTAISAPTCTEARFAWDERTRAIRLLCNNNGVVEERRSDSDALDFNAPVTVFAAGTHPDITASREGLILYAAYVSGALSIRRRYPGDAAPAAAFDAEDDTATPLLIEDSDFRLCYAPNGWLWLHWLPDGATDTALWFSTDDGESFQISSGTPTGIANGEHPGMCCGHDGTLYAYAYTAGTITLTRRAPGDVDWSTPEVVQDDAAADLLIENQPFSMAEAFEGSRRLILACLADGDSVASEWFSGSDGEGFERFPFA